MLENIFIIGKKESSLLVCYALSKINKSNRKVSHVRVAKSHANFVLSSQEVELTFTSHNHFTIYMYVCMVHLKQAANANKLDSHL